MTEHYPDQPADVGIARPDLILISDQNAAEAAFGCDQDWFADYWQRQAGCGPCTAATLLYYLSRRHPDYARLYTAASHNREDFTQFMSEIWHYVTPGSMGVNEASILADGVQQYAACFGFSLQPHILKVPALQHASRPTADEFTGFIRAGLQLDCPVAFLNLSNGQLTNLDNWHWVTITQLDSHGIATIADSGERKTINLILWYNTSLLGGALVYFVDGSRQ